MYRRGTSQVAELEGSPHRETIATRRVGDGKGSDAAIPDFGKLHTVRNFVQFRIRVELSDDRGSKAIGEASLPVHPSIKISPLMVKGIGGSAGDVGEVPVT